MSKRKLPATSIHGAEIMVHAALEPESPNHTGHPEDEVPFGPQGAQFLCNLLQHGVFLGAVVFMLMVIGYFGER